MFKKITITSLILSSSALSPLVHADNKVILVKGQANVKEGQVLKVGDTITTGPDSAVKVFLNDGTEISVGPQSKFKIDSLAQDEPSLFSMAFGQLRAKVKKSVDNDGRPKALIRTSSSVMGVRGTDFQVVYNQKSQMTSLVTYEGQVAMVRADGLEGPPSAALAAYSSARAEQMAVVNPGQFSGVSLAQAAPLIPVKVSPAQLEVLKNNELGVLATRNAAVASPENTIPPVPPGIDSKLMAPESQAASTGTALSAEGGVDPGTGRVAPPAGGFVDLTTGAYLPPPPGSTYDAATGVYVPPPSLGVIHPETGAFVPPPGFAVDPVQGLMKNDPATGAPVAVGVGGAAALAKPVAAMIAPPPPPGVAPSAAIAGAPGPQPPVIKGSQTGTVEGRFPALVDGQPLFPVYNPFLCPPYCDPAYQPGFYPGAAFPVGNTRVNFIIE